VGVVYHPLVRRPTAVVLGFTVVLAGGYLAAVLWPRGNAEPPPEAPTYTITQTIPGVGSGGIVGTGTQQP